MHAAPFFIRNTPASVPPTAISTVVFFMPCALRRTSLRILYLPRDGAHPEYVARTCAMLWYYYGAGIFSAILHIDAFIFDSMAVQAHLFARRVCKMSVISTVFMPISWATATDAKSSSLTTTSGDSDVIILRDMSLQFL